MFEIVDNGQTDHGRTPDHGYTISSPGEPSAQVLKKVNSTKQTTPINKTAAFNISGTYESSNRQLHYVIMPIKSQPQNSNSSFSK